MASDDPGLFHTLYTTRALRRFRPEPVADDVLFQVFDAAIRAPSGQNAQDWRFVIVRDRATKERMASWSREAWKGYRERYGDIGDLPRTQRLSLASVRDLAHDFADVPVVVVVCGMRGRHGTPGGSVFPAVQNLLLAARGMGLGGSIFNLALRRAELAEMLAVPEIDEIHCVVVLGYPADAHGPVRRKPVAKVVYDERFGVQWGFATRQPEEGWGDRWS